MTSPGRAPKPIGSITARDVVGAVRGLSFGRAITGLGFDFEPSIGLVAKRIDKLGLEFESFRDPLRKAILKVMIPSFRKNFDQGGRPDGWEPLAAYTIKQRGYDAWPILVRSGKLKKAATSISIWDIGVSSAIIRSLPDKVWYGYLHQAGYGGFGTYMKQAEKEDPSASAREKTARAFELMEEKRGEGGAARIQIPQRQFILYQDEDIDDIRDIFVEWLGEKVEEAQARL